MPFKRALPLALFLGSSLFVRALPAEFIQPRFNPGLAVYMATGVLQKEHFKRTPLNDNLSRKWHRSFLLALDPERMYFQEVDLREFEKFADKLDDFAANGDFQFPELVRAKFQQRVREAMEYRRNFATVTHTYACNEARPLKYERYAATPEELRERWRLRTKGELLGERASGATLENAQALVTKRCERVLQYARELDDDALCEVYLNSLARVYDAHSDYMSPHTSDSFNM